MPSSGGLGQYQPGHVRSYSSVDHGLRVIHSGTWVGGCQGPDDHVESIHVRTPRVRTTEVREHGQFVTVVEVEKKEEEEDKSSGLACHASRAATQPVPSPPPRGFVTVVAVGSNSDASVHHQTDSVAMDANLNLRVELSSDAEADYVNQEMIDRERETVQKSQGEAGGTSSVPDQVVVYRLPGERLGLGLKFDGGMGAQECVRRLFIQSVAPDSPAARAAVPWGELQSGDQILNIEGCSVSSMTRVQCVSFLKDAAMKITIGVLKGNGQLPEFDACNLEGQEYMREEDGEEDANDDSLHLPPLIVGEMRKRVPPPPLPPRARPRKSPARPPKDPLPIPPPPSAFQDIDDETSVEKIHSSSLSISENSEDRDQHIHGWREFVLSRRNRPGDLGELLEDLEFHIPRTWTTRRLEESVDAGLPPRPTFYLDLVGEEDAMGPCESESDETSSSVSTVIDRLSLSSSTTVSRNSSFNATADASRFDLARALSPFEQLEKELETEPRSEAQQQTPATGPRDEVVSAPPVDRSTKPVTTESPSPEVDTPSPVSRKPSSSKIKMRPSIKSFSFSLKGRPFSWQQAKGVSERVDRGTGRAETFLSIKRPGKRPAPPPPPRSIDSGTIRTDSPVTTTSTISTDTSTKHKGETTENSTSCHESDNYVDLIAEAAKQNVDNVVENVPHDTSGKEAGREEPSDVPTLVQVREPKPSADYLLILDSPPGDDVLDKFSDKSFYTNVEVDAPVELTEPSKDSGNTIPETPIELRVAGQDPGCVNESLLMGKTPDTGSPLDEDDYVVITSPSCMETRALVHHSSEDTVQSGNLFKCPDKASRLTETDLEEELCDSKDPNDSSEEEVSEEANESDFVDASTEMDASVEVDANGTADVSDEINDGEEVDSRETDESKVYNSTDTEDSTNYDIADIDNSEEAPDDVLGRDDDYSKIDDSEADEGSYVLDDGHYECFLSCSSPKTSPSEPPLGKPLLIPGVLPDDEGDLELYDDLYVESPIDRPRGGPQDLNNNRNFRLEQTPALPSVPEEESGEQDTTDENLQSLYEDVAGTDANESEPLGQGRDDVQATSVSSGEVETADAEGSRTITQCVRQRRLRQDIGDLIRKEMNFDDDVTVEVEEEEEVESLVECEDEKELLLVMRALRQDQPGDHIRWLQDDSDEDDGGDDKGGSAGAGEAAPDEDGSEDPPGSMGGDPQAGTPPPGDQSAPQDAGRTAARALSDPQGGCEPSLTPSPQHHAAAQIPATLAAAAASLHSLARGTSRHPHNHSPPPPLRHTARLGTCGDSCGVDRPVDTATDQVISRHRHSEDQEETFGFHSKGSVDSDGVGVTRTVACEGSTVSVSGACDAQCQVGVTHPKGGQEGVNRSVSDSEAVMVARTDTNQAGKVTSCPDDLQSLSPLTPQVKQDMDDPLTTLASSDTSSQLTLTPQDADGASTTAGSCDAGSNGPLTPSAFCSDGEEQEEEGEGEGRRREDTPEPPDFSTHPDFTERREDSQLRLEEPPTDGSVGAEPITAGPREPPSQSQDERDALGHGDLHTDSGGGGSVRVSACEQRYSSSSSSSSSGGAPPPYSRLPPDGHEFPSSYAEGLPDKLSRYARYSRLAMELDSPNSPSSSPTSTTSTPRTRSAPGTPLGPPPPIPRTSPTTAKTYTTERSLDVGGNKWTGGEDRKSREPTPTRNRWRRQDERSEKSVRDKIAMFSTDAPDQPYPKTRKLDKLEGDETTMKRAFTEDDVRLENSTGSGGKSGREVHNGSRSLSKTSAFSSMINVSTTDTKDSAKVMSQASSEVDIRQDIPSVQRRHDLREEKRAEDDSAATGLHSRSQSLIDIGRSTLTKRHSVGAYDRPSVYQYGIEKPEERERRTSLTNLIEQRRKSYGCKLRGLVIPESRNSEGGDKASIDLPRIASVPPSTATKTMSLPREGQRSPRLYKADSISSIDSCESNTSRHSSLNAPPWKNHNTSTLPKYSPAFKRKNMAVFNKCDNLPPLSGRSHSTRSTSPTSDLSQVSPVPPVHTPPKSLDTITTSGSEHSFEYSDSRYNSDRHGYGKLPLSQKSSLDSRLSRAEDSDNDSAVSSTQSSFSQGMSPPSSPMPEHDESDERRSRGYRSRLSPQSSIDEQEAARRVLKRGSIEAENRRNVLNSARCSSGRSSDEQQTPEIIRKYSTDTVEEPSRFPQRLDTELREGPKVTGLRRQPSSSSTSSTASSRRSSHDSSRRNSKDSVIHVNKYDEVKVSAEPVYFDQEGEMYKESQLKVAYLNEIVDDFEQLNEPVNQGVIAEVPLSSSRRVVETSEQGEGTSSCSTRRSERWAALEMKYGSSNPNSDMDTKIQRLRRSSDSTSPDRTKKNSGGFRALAEKWQQRAEEDATSLPQPQLLRRESVTRLEPPARPSRLYDDTSSVASTLERPSRPSRMQDGPSEAGSDSPTRPTGLYSESTQLSRGSDSSEARAESLDIPRAGVPDRKLSMPEYGSGGIKMRDRREGGSGGAPSRPTSLIESGDGGVMESHYLSGGAPLSPAASSDSRDDLCSTPETSLSRTASKEVLDAFARPRASLGASFPRTGSSTTPKMADIMRAFERHDLGKRASQGGGSSHPRMSSLDSTASDDGSLGAQYGSVTSLASGQRDQYGSITSLASSTSLISPQELAQLIEEANQSLEESGTPSHEILVVVLHREIVGHGSIGITLAGGADYEAKEITVHKVIPGSLADRDGRIQRGDRVLSINGKNLRGVTHREALTILKSPRPEVVLVLSRSRSVTPQESNTTESEGSFVHRPALINHVTSPRPPKILESPMDSKSLISDTAATSFPRGPPLTITLMKDGAGLGFSLEGGKDSPMGDRPLTVKKIFSGGVADKGGVMKVGDELVSVNTVDVTGMARIEAWNFLKKLPDGTVTLILRQKLEDPSVKNEE